MNVTGLTRLIPTECEVGGWPPLSVTFQTEEDRKEVLSRAGSLAECRKAGELQPCGDDRAYDRCQTEFKKRRSGSVT